MKQKCSRSTEVYRIDRVRIPYYEYRRIINGSFLGFQRAPDSDQATELSWEQNLSRYWDQQLEFAVQRDEYSGDILFMFIIPYCWKPDLKSGWWRNYEVPEKEARKMTEQKAEKLKPTFGSIAYDEQSKQASDNIKSICCELETAIEAYLSDSRERSQALIKLEECFMWVGKAVRNDQQVRIDNGKD